jgi:hypothetical protein
MCDTESVRRSISLFIDPSECHPIACEGDVSSHLNRSRLELNVLERQSLSSLRGYPIGNVIFTDRCGTNRRLT